MGVSPIAVPPALAQVLNSAGEKSGVDFEYLLQTAIRESSLDASARASSSSAVGLFQFLESTWLQVLKEEGPRLGYGKYADAITTNASGDYVVRDKGVRREILALREDPQMAADLAAAFTRANGTFLEQRFGRMPSAGELYIAHFLGPQGAARLLAAGLEDPEQVAADLFPRQARANPTIFYSGGEPRTIKELYRALVSKHGAATPAMAETPAFATQQFANDAGAGTGRWPGEIVPSRVADMSFAGFYATGESAPVLAVEALQSLVAPEISAPIANAYAPVAPAPTGVSELGFVPLPAPVPLTPPGSPAEVAPADAPPRARVLLSPGVAERSALAAQLYGRR